jgi:hypothetical protein
MVLTMGNMDKKWFFFLVLCWDRVYSGGYSVSVLVSSHGRHYILVLN